MRKALHLLPVVCLALAVLLAGGCPSGERPIVVGSKNFSEQVLLGEIVAQAIERATPLRVDRRLNLGGTFVCDHAIRAGEIDLYVEYTGTALAAILKQPPLRDPEKVLATVRARYGEDGLEWSTPFGFDNTFALVIRGADVRHPGLETISEAAAVTPGWRIAVGYEFLERADGFRGLVETYGLRFREPPKVMDLGLLYRALIEKQVDVVVGNATDGVIESQGLAILEDDRHYFPPYEAAPVVRTQTLERHPELRGVLARLGNTISTREMRELNYQVDGEHRPAEEVAQRFVDRLLPTATSRGSAAGDRPANAPG